MTMIKSLKKYYKEKGISAVNFNCRHYYDCKKDSLKFTEAKEATVGEEYEKGEIPRLLFISLDSGSAEKDPYKRTLEYNRKYQNIHHVLEWPQHKHWYRTHQLASCILGNFKENLKEVNNVRQCFAHTNSAKCCENNPGRAQASSRLFKNCKKYISGEVIVLNPNIVITQGAWAREVIEIGFKVIKYNEKFEEVKVILVGEKPVLWIHTYHPRNGYFNSKNLPNFQEYSRIAYEFVTKNKLPRYSFKLMPSVAGNHLAVRPPKVAKNLKPSKPKITTALTPEDVSRKDQKQAIEMLYKARAEGMRISYDCPRLPYDPLRNQTAYQVGLVLKAGGNYELAYQFFVNAKEKKILNNSCLPQTDLHWTMRVLEFVKYPPDWEIPETPKG